MIAVIEEDDFEKFMVNHSLVQDYANATMPQRYEPRPLELVLAKDESDGNWYRCAFLDGTDSAELYAIDWCRKVKTAFEHIRVSPF